MDHFTIIVVQICAVGLFLISLWHINRSAIINYKNEREAGIKTAVITEEKEDFIEPSQPTPSDLVFKIQIAANDKL